MSRSEAHQRYGDRWAKTMVIAAAEARMLQPSMTTGRAVLGVACAALVYGAVSASGLVWQAM